MICVKTDLRSCVIVHHVKGKPDQKRSPPGGILRLPAALRWELVAVVVAKLGLLALLYVLFFSPAHRPAVDVVAHIVGAGSQR